MTTTTRHDTILALMGEPPAKGPRRQRYAEALARIQTDADKILDEYVEAKEAEAQMQKSITKLGRYQYSTAPYFKLYEILETGVGENGKYTRFRLTFSESSGVVKSSTVTADTATFLTTNLKSITKRKYLRLIEGLVAEEDIRTLV